MFQLIIKKFDPNQVILFASHTRRDFALFGKLIPIFGQKELSVGLNLHYPRRGPAVDNLNAA
jgi:hypothetical protein